MKVTFNFPPTIAKRYVMQWKEQVLKDEKADEQLKKIMQDVCTLVEVGIKALKNDRSNES